MSYPKFDHWICILVAILFLNALPIWSQSVVYSDEQKRTLVYLVPQGWNMNSDEYLTAYMGAASLPGGLLADNIVSTSIQVRGDFFNGYSQMSTNLIRLMLEDGFKTWGGQFHLNCDNYPQCNVQLMGGSGDQVIGQYRTSPKHVSAAAPRIYVKLDYLTAGTTPISQTVNTYYFPIGSWDMSLTNASKELQVSLPSLNINNIAGVSATIHSNPSNGMIMVNNFERRGYASGVLNGKKLERGGVITVVPESNPATGSTAKLLVPLLGNNIQGDDNISNMYNDGRHGANSANRGWVKVTYAGSASPSQPYAVKSKTVPLGPWAIFSANAEDREHTLSLSSLNVAPNRILHAEAAIHADRNPGSSSNEHKLTNLMRTSYSGLAGTDSDHGLFYIDQATNAIKLFATTRMIDFFPLYYANSHESATDNRGWFSVDYLAGTCTQGPGGFNIRGIPSANTGTCVGNNQPFVIEGAGRGTLTNASTDSLTYVYKASTQTNLTVTVKVDGQVNADAYGLAGVMFRASLNTDSRNAAAVTTPHGNPNSVNLTYFRRRLADGNGTQVTTATNTTARWLRIKKAGNVFRAYYSTSTSNTMPASFTEFANSPQTINFPTGSNNPYYVGLQVSNLTDSRLNRVTFRGYSETIP